MTSDGDSGRDWMLIEGEDESSPFKRSCCSDRAVRFVLEYDTRVAMVSFLGFLEKRVCIYFFLKCF